MPDIHILFYYYAHCQDIEKYKLGNPRMFHYLNQSNFYELDGVDESKEYVKTRKAMEVVGINSDEQVIIWLYVHMNYSHRNSLLKVSFSQDAIFRVVAAILHLGNVEFAKGEEADSSEPKDEKSRSHLKTAAELFMQYMHFLNIILTVDITILMSKVVKGKSLIFYSGLGVMRSPLKTPCVNV